MRKRGALAEFDLGVVDAVGFKGRENFAHAHGLVLFHGFGLSGMSQSDFSHS